MSQKYSYAHRPKSVSRTQTEDYQQAQLPAKHAHMLQLQRTIGNRAVNSLVNITPAAKKIQRVGYDRIDGSCIYSDVQEGNDTITMTGKLRRDHQTVDDINAHLDYHYKQFPMSKVDDSFLSRFRNVDTLEITVVDAAPRGKRIGQLLSYHLALVAQAQGIEYITAQNVTDARAPFYTPLGFQDALDEPSWAGLVNEKQQIEVQLRQDPPPPNMPQLLNRHEQISQLMSSNMIFIKTDALLQNAQAAFGAQWQRS